MPLCAAPLCSLLLALPALAQDPPQNPVRPLQQPAAPAPLPAQASAPAPGEEDAQHPFAIPETRAAKARIARAAEHIAAARWSEAIDELQKLLEEHRGEMLGGEKALPGRARESDEPVYAGASQRARELLFALPAAARAIYQARFAAPAQAALAHARAQHDRRELAEVGRRWPLTQEAELAWWSLGDLELEEGRTREARLCWNRALAVRLLRPELELVTPDDWNGAAAELADGDARSKAAAARARGAALLAADTRSEAARDDEEALGSLHTGLAGRTSGQGPARGASAWAQPWRMEDPVPSLIPRLDAFFLARAGDLLFVNPPLHVVALNAWSGAPVWQTDEPEGWNRLTREERRDLDLGVDQEGVLYAPAANTRVVVGVLQLPFSLTEVRYFSNMRITVPIPQKRLYAFEARTGRPLWNHRPPAGWDGGPAPFEQRMIVAGPPVISGDRVLAPLYQFDGRIDYHVGCFDLDTGALLWSRALISGQRELNMFGRPPHEFSAPPLVVEGARVFALTQLGTVACLDLFSGEVLWQTRYEQIPIPKNTSMQATEMQNVWRPAAPVVSGRTLIATPFDSRDMLGIDVLSGALVWTLPNNFFVQQGAARSAYQELLLVGAGERSVYVMGQAIVGLSARAGLDRERPTAPLFLYSHEDLQKNLNALGRPAIAGQRLVVPLLAGRVDLELPSGHELPPVAWAPGQSGGNVFVGRGELFTISRSGVEGYFEWQQMVERARAEHRRSPDDPRAAELCVQLLGTAADNALSDGKSEAARAAIEEARGLLEDFARRLGALPPALAASLHRTLRLESRVRAALADGDRARAALRLARECAPTLEDLRDTLLEELALAQPHSTARAEILETLEQRVPSLSLECLQPAPSDGHAPDALEWNPVLAPGTSEAEPRHVTLTVGLWVLLERAGAARRAHDVPSELASLEGVLGQPADTLLPGGASGALARARVAELYAGSGKDVLEGYEQRARVSLEAARARGDREALARIPLLYPCTRAAAQADDARVDLALAAGAPGELLGILSGEIHGEWSLAHAGTRELELLARAALGFEAEGNRELAAELLRALAAARPDFRPASPAAAGQDLAALAAARPRLPQPESAPPVGRFRPDAARLWSLAGEFQVLGRTLPDDPATEALQLVAGTEQRQGGCFLRAWSGANLDQPAWVADVSAMIENGRLDAGAWRVRLGCARGRVVCAAPNSVIGLDERSGEIAWQWSVEPAEVECASLALSAGVVLVALQPGDWLQALDARSGTPLWQIHSPGSGVRALPLCSSNQLVFLPPIGGREFALHDLFTGARTSGFTLDAQQAAPPKLEEDAWIEGDRLLMPWIDNKRSQVECWDLAQRRRSWHLDLAESPGNPRILTSVLQFGARTWLWLRPGQGAPAEANPSLQELSTGIGALAPLSNVRLSIGDRPLGPLARGRRRLCSSELFLFSERPQAKEETRVRCIDLTAGERWSATLRAPFQEIKSMLTPLPALSAENVLLAYTPGARSDRTSSTRSSVVFLDRANGLAHGDKALTESFGRSDALEFVPLGDGLLVRGERTLEVWR